MRRLVNLIFITVSVLPLLLCVGACVLWARSYGQFDVTITRGGVGVQVQGSDGRVKLTQVETADVDVDGPPRWRVSQKARGGTWGVSPDARFVRTGWGPVQHGRWEKRAGLWRRVELDEARAELERHSRSLAQLEEWERSAEYASLPDARAAGNAVRRARMKAQFGVFQASAMVEQVGPAWEVMFPAWALAAAAGVLPAIVVTRGVRKRRRRRWAARGRCGVCGYDLRATPGRCPECGTGAAGEVA